MALSETLVSKPPPIREDNTGTLRVGGTRVTLDTLVGDFLDGATAEEIAVSYPTLKLEDVYGAISYYLANRTAVNEYLSRRRQEARSLQEGIERSFPPNGTRSRLVARSDHNQS